MAPRRKGKSAPGETRPFKIYLPQDVSERIEQKAKERGWPRNRVIINELAEYPRSEQIGLLADQVGAMGNVLARYSSRIVMHDLSEELLQALDAVLAAEGSAQQTALERVRVIRSTMLKTK